ncbi:MAG: hypothetical protein AB8F26_08130 [Phycisphaerales bacterium]
MSMSAGKGILADSTKALYRAWRRCQEHWTDENARRFGQEFIDPIEPATRQTIEAMDRLQSACDEARRTCE